MFSQAIFKLQQSKTVHTDLYLVWELNTNLLNNHIEYYYAMK